MGYTYGKKRGSIRKHPLYASFWNMLKRCENPKYEFFEHYGGRGIKVCERWNGENGFRYFIEDMGERPKEYQLDRIDVNGNYEPSNCRWANKYIQMGNTRKNNVCPGVSWHKQRGRHRARIKVKGKEISLGLYNTFEEAVEARKKAEVLYVS